MIWRSGEIGEKTREKCYGQYEENTETAIRLLRKFSAGAASFREVVSFPHFFIFLVFISASDLFFTSNWQQAEEKD